MSTAFDTPPVHFTLPGQDARGRFVRLDSVLREILAAHDYPTSIKLVLAEAITICALIGSLMKQDGGQVTIQAQTEGGVIELLVVDYRGGELRGHVRFDADRLSRLGANPSLFAMFGKGYLALTFDQSFGKGRYQGIVPLDGDSLAQACESYFTQSEQVPTMIRIAIESDATGCRSAGFLIQHLPEGEEGRERLHVRLDHPQWEHVSILAGTLSHGEMLDPALSGRDILWRLFHEEDEVRTADGPALVKGCRCNIDHIRDVIGRFPAEEQAEMVGDSGTIAVDCAFCSRVFHIEPVVPEG